MKENRKRILLISVILLMVVAFWMLDLHQYFTLEFIKSRQGAFDALYARHGVWLVAGYMLIYIIMAALSLPGATVLTLAGGALFGFWVTLVATSFASTIGATIAAAVSRYLLRDWVQERFAVRLSKINEGVAREGALYLFTLRLVPVFPFFLINLCMGLTPMKLVTFYWVSQIGMLAGTAVYVNAGTQLGQLESLSGIVSPSLLFSFALLGVFPLAMRKIMNMVRKKPVSQ